MSYAAYRDPERVRGGLSAPYDVALVNGAYATVQDGRVVSVTVDGVVHDLRAPPDAATRWLEMNPVSAADMKSMREHVRFPASMPRGVPVYYCEETGEMYPLPHGRRIYVRAD